MKTTACFTGHRPEKLMFESEEVLKMIKSTLYFQIYDAVQNGFDKFISGVARGVDIWAAEYVLRIREEFPHIKLICAVPFHEHAKSFKGEDLYMLNSIMENADEVVYVSEHYSHDCFKKRNYYMVDRSSLLIGIVYDKRSGTGQTINYARKKGIVVSVQDLSSICIDKTEAVPKFNIS